MYDDLIKRLRNGLSCYGERCLSCPDKKHCTTKYQQEAADAIEKLQKQLREEKVDNVNLTGWLAEEHANQCPYYIRNVHDRGDDSLCTKWECEVKVLPKWIPVTERLPEKNIEVLVFAEGKIEGFFGDTVIAISKRYDFKIFTDSEGVEVWQSPWQYFLTDYEITHWMPLPESPKDGE